ncbi:hypothetical protein KIP30_gp28 [Mycobacterium phage Pistachio]|uniref:Uncharacterized protein n=1 Tax=Mycobacterium phage Pistachio TaxID=2126722 RepID=A0A2R4A2E1_9CAUD|nr:hypothetical protein KIP30_gp28 [Mycobacterium phage Pistachio]AQT28469.1 hypothetical protein SEA_IDLEANDCOVERT_70 [Mycobacterium phage Idleandcovert]AVR57052.1 hypothetical protein PBI_PUPPY_70 [Mycobacterium phage Puppy]AVR77480.1 hypothetical protein SEA_TNGUYEN7_70 [Mycobacterium phage TNguyen7]WAB10255.1 hypothetical protein PBI_BLUEBIRD_72 [Mycobacterium phage BlueBird]AVR57141.1 hypothetical protein PBI_PISTACHIO_69 [Mycobacterium phage Pistachio]
MNDRYTVHLGPKPGMPPWHVLNAPSAHSFPSVEAATRFSKTHKEIDPTRDIVIEYPDGRRWNGKAWQ